MHGDSKLKREVRWAAVEGLMIEPGCTERKVLLMALTCNRNFIGRR